MWRRSQSILTLQDWCTDVIARTVEGIHVAVGSPGLKKPSIKVFLVLFLSLACKLLTLNATWSDSKAQLVHNEYRFCSLNRQHVLLYQLVQSLSSILELEFMFYKDFAQCTESSG